MTEQNSERLPGMPGPPSEAIQRREEIEKALGQLHDVLSPMLEGLPRGKESQGSISIWVKVQGDTVIVTVKPGSKE
jgi:hypothetical protein